MIVLISGKQGSGKDMLSENLKSYFTHEERRTVYITKYAKPLYEMHDACRKILKKYDIKDYDFGRKDGNLLQLLGTEWGRNTIKNSIWVDCVRNEYDQVAASVPDPNYNLIFIINDCRMVNEFEAFPEAITIRLEASKEVRKARCEHWREKDNHPSEIELDDHVRNGLFDAIINTEHLGPNQTRDEAIKIIKNPELIREKYGLEKILGGAGTDARPELFS